MGTHIRSAALTPALLLSSMFLMQVSPLVACFCVPLYFVVGVAVMAGPVTVAVVVCNTLFALAAVRTTWSPFRGDTALSRLRNSSPGFRGRAAAEVSLPRRVDGRCNAAHRHQRARTGRVTGRRARAAQPCCHGDTFHLRGYRGYNGKFSVH